MKFDYIYTMNTSITAKDVENLMLSMTEHDTSLLPTAWVRVHKVGLEMFSDKEFMEFIQLSNEERLIVYADSETADYIYKREKELGL